MPGAAHSGSPPSFPSPIDVLLQAASESGRGKLASLVKPLSYFLPHLALPKVFGAERLHRGLHDRPDLIAPDIRTYYPRLSRTACRTNGVATSPHPDAHLCHRPEMVTAFTNEAIAAVCAASLSSDRHRSLNGSRPRPRKRMALTSLSWADLPLFPLPDNARGRRLRAFVELGKRAIKSQLAAEQVAVTISRICCCARKPTACTAPCGGR